MPDLDERTNKEYEKANVAPAPVEQRQELSDRLQTKNKSNDLEGKTKTMFSAFKKFTLWDWVKVGATSTFGIATSGLLNWASVMGSFLLAYKTLHRKKKITYDGVKSEVHLANFYTPLVYGFYKNLDKITNPFLKTGLGLGPLMFAFMPTYLAMEYVVKHFSPSKMFKYIATGKIFKLPSEIYQNTIKPNFKQSLKDFYKFLTLPWIAVVNFVPLKYQIPAISGLRYLFRYVTGKSQMKNNTQEKTKPKKEYGSLVDRTRKSLDNFFKHPDYKPA